MVRVRDTGDVRSDKGRIQRYSIDDESMTLIKLETTRGYYSATWDTDKTAAEFLDYTKNAFQIRKISDLRATVDYVDENQRYDTVTGRLKQIEDEPWFPNSINFLELSFSHIDAAWIDTGEKNQIELTVYEANPDPIEQYFMGTATIPQISGDAFGDKEDEIAREALSEVRTLIESDVSS